MAFLSSRTYNLNTTAEKVEFLAEFPKPFGLNLRVTNAVKVVF